MIAAPALAGGLDCLPDPPIDGDEALEAHGQGVRGTVGLHVVVRQLEPGQHEQVVRASRPRRLPVDLGEIRSMKIRPYAGVGPLIRVEPGVVDAHDVVRDAEHVEAVRAVDIDELGNRQRAVAPRRVRVKLGEQRVLCGLSSVRSCPRPTR